MTKIYGYCGVITNPNNSIVAEATFFDECPAAGFDNSRYQKNSLRNILCNIFAKKHLNEWLVKEIDEIFCDELWKVAEKAGYKMHFIPVDYNDDN